MIRSILIIAIVVVMQLASVMANNFPDSLAQRLQSFLEEQLEVEELTGLSAAVSMPDHGLWIEILMVLFDLEELITKMQSCLEE